MNAIVSSVLLVLISCVALGGPAPRPNILYVYVDDLGWGSIGPNGQSARKAANLPSVLTPNIDRLAAQGVNFSRAYGCTVCSPARSSQQSGFHQGHTFADRNDPNNAKKAMRADDRLMGDLLSEVGYVTGYWGKWGYGGSKDLENPVIQNIQTLPSTHGYQHVLAELHHVRAHTFFQPSLWRAPAGAKAIGGLELVPNSLSGYSDSSRFPNKPVYQHDSAYPSVAYCDDMYAFAALDFIRTQAKNFHQTGQPFFGLIAFQVPHAPFGEIAQLPKWDEAYKNQPFFDTLPEQAKHWAAMVTRIDSHLGNLLNALSDPNGDEDSSDSIAENTLVIFQSDNGGPQHRARDVFVANGGLRGRKGQIYEGGIRVPTVMRWPSRINESSILKQGENCDYVIDVSDMLPTFCELAGGLAPPGLDGVSIAPMLTGMGVQRRRDFLIHEAGGANSIIHGRYKLISNRNEFALFDLVSDPGETSNLAASQEDRVAQLQRILREERVGEPRGFANTYHHWMGPIGGAISEAAHWSDYVYENEGVRYLEDAGPPQNSWTAVFGGRGTTVCVAHCNSEVNFLGLEIRGGEQKRGEASVVLGPEGWLSGRNEIRIARGGSLDLAGGAVSSLRWLDIRVGGLLEGWGRVASDVYNAGRLTVSGFESSQRAKLRIDQRYVALPGAILRIPLDAQGSIPMHVKGRAYLDGILEIATDGPFESVPGEVYMVLSAERVEGRFANESNKVVSSTGVEFRISYYGSKVTVTVL